MNPDYPLYGGPVETEAQRGRRHARRKLAEFRAGYDRMTRDRRNKAARRTRRKNRR